MGRLFRLPTMHNPLAKIALLALLGGGFALTGDLGRLKARGMRLLESTTVPSESPLGDAGLPAQAPVDASPMPLPAAPAAQPPVPAPAPSPPAAPAAVHHIDDEAPIPVPASDMLAAQAPRPPAQGSGPQAVDLASLAAGTRILVWLPAEPGRQATPRCLAIDLVDPRTGEALLHRELTLKPGSNAVRTAGVPSRVTIRSPDSAGLFGGTSGASRILVGGAVECRPLGLAHATAADRPEMLGPIAAIMVER